MTTTLLDPPGRLQTERLGDGRRRLLRELAVSVHGRELRVPEGFDTDYSSIPPMFAWLVRWSKVDLAGVVHDWLYDRGCTEQITRAEADRIWFCIARAGAHRANWVQASLAWLALRWVAVLEAQVILVGRGDVRRAGA
ncbi:MAG: DUF1353 domain-containing protein [Planctomycetota bacterium]|nr:DUF1353 domain-containing protein [Planctomycetota bacterium]